MLQLENLFERPVKMVGDVGYLLMELIEGVAYDPPVAALPVAASPAAPGSTSN
jgi:hypothetical protein